MSLESLKAALPIEPALSDEQRGVTFIASALAARNPAITEAILGEFGSRTSPEAVTAAKSAASITAMNNIYYRFTHLVGGDYPKLPAKLRMNVMASLIRGSNAPRSNHGRWRYRRSMVAACAWKTMSGSSLTWVDV